MPQRQRLLEVCVYIFIVSVRQPVGEEGELGRRRQAGTLSLGVYSRQCCDQSQCVHKGAHDTCILCALRAPTLPADIQRQ